MIIQTSRFIKKSFPILGGIVLGTLLTVSITSIAAQVNNTTINACYKNNTGALRILRTNESCAGNETPISWNQQGPVGPTGPAGNGFGGYTTDQLIDYDNINEPFVYRNFVGANFTSSEIKEFIFRSNFTNANFSESSFTAVVTESNFSNANFTNANLSGSNFSNTTLTNATWSNTICPDGTNSDNNGNTCEGHLVP